jgi:YihY family inner membrane protein
MAGAIAVVGKRLDLIQQAHRPTAFVFAVVKKFGDDRGGSLAALIAYYGYLSLFPMLLLFVTVVGYILPNYPGAQRQLKESVLSQFPVIGPQLGASVQPLRGNPVALTFAILGLLWGSLGISQTLQFVMHEVWDVPQTDRPGFVSRLIRSLLLYGVLAVGVAATTVLSAVGPHLVPGILGSVLAAIPAALVNVGLFYLAFRVLSPSTVKSRDLIPGVIVGGVGWQLLQSVGVNLVAHQLRHASQIYGFFGLTIGLLGFLYLAGQLTVYSAEINVVLARRLWPRSIIQPAPAPAH